MTNIVTWEYYSSLYKKIAEEEFPAAEHKAEMAVSEIIGPVRWATITTETFGYTILRDTICEVIDKMAEHESSGAGKGLSSVSNDGYTESYAVTDAQAQKEELQSLIKTMLSGTGMVGAY